MNLGQFLSLPMAAGPNDRARGGFQFDEAGNPVNQTVMGDIYAIKPEATAEAKRRKAVNDAMLAAAQAGKPFDPALSQARQDGPSMGDLLKGVAEGAWQGVSAPGRALAGETLTMGDVAATALDWGAMGAVGSAPKGATRMFAGRNAKTADMDALARAESMAGRGASRDEIWRDTGWFKGADDQWRFEIDDSGAVNDVVAAADEVGPGERLPLGGVIEHKSLYEAYPELSDADAFLLPKDRMEAVAPGAYGGVTDSGQLALRNDIVDTGRPLHEIQHLIQQKEGFAKGGSTVGVPRADYDRLAGEVKARNTQSRALFDADLRRENPPWSTQDVPESQQIVRMRNPNTALGADRPGITAYHGSPHDFDRFQMDKIGTGEGGALLGRGVNLSDNPRVADYYNDQLAGGRGTRYEVRINADDADFLDFNAPISSQSPRVQEAARRLGVNMEAQAPVFNWSNGRGTLKLGGNKRFGDVREVRGGFEAKVGKDQIGVFSSADKAGAALQDEAARRGISGSDADISGYDLYTRAGGREGGSEALRDAGIPGSKMSGEYGSAGKSTDYAVYDESIIDIVRKYGIAGAAAMLGISEAQIEDQMGQGPLGNYLEQ